MFKGLEVDSQDGIPLWENASPPYASRSSETEEAIPEMTAEKARCRALILALHLARCNVPQIPIVMSI